MMRHVRWLAMLAWILPLQTALGQSPGQVTCQLLSGGENSITVSPGVAEFHLAVHLTSNVDLSAVQFTLNGSSLDRFVFAGGVTLGAPFTQTDYNFIPPVPPPAEGVPLTALPQFTFFRLAMGDYPAASFTGPLIQFHLRSTEALADGTSYTFTLDNPAVASIWIGVDDSTNEPVSDVITMAPDGIFTLIVSSGSGTGTGSEEPPATGGEPPDTSDPDDTDTGDTGNDDTDTGSDSGDTGSDNPDDATSGSDPDDETSTTDGTGTEGTDTGSTGTDAGTGSDTSNNGDAEDPVADNGNSSTGDTQSGTESEDQTNAGEQTDDTNSAATNGTATAGGSTAEASDTNSTDGSTTQTPTRKPGLFAALGAWLLAGLGSRTAVRLLAAGTIVAGAVSVASGGITWLSRGRLLRPRFLPRPVWGVVGVLAFLWALAGLFQR